MNVSRSPASIGNAGGHSGVRRAVFFTSQVSLVDLMNYVPHEKSLANAGRSDHNHLPSGGILGFCELEKRGRRYLAIMSPDLWKMDSDLTSLTMSRLIIIGGMSKLC